MPSPRSLIPVRLGNLLTAANLVRPDSLAQALQQSRASKRPLGEVLVESGLVSQPVLDAAVRMQQLIKEGTVTQDAAAQILKRIQTEGISLEQALGWNETNQVKVVDLAQLLLDAGCISAAHIEQAAVNCAQNRLPLGRNLVLNRVITPSVLSCALSALVLVRDNRITFEKAVEGLRRSSKEKISLEEAVGLPPESATHVKVGELLAQSGIVSESDAMIAVESGLQTGQPIGELMMGWGLVAPVVLDGAIKLQRLIATEHTTRGQAVELLRQVAEKGVELERFLAEMKRIKGLAVNLLAAAGLVRAEDVATAAQQYPDDIIRGTVVCGYIDEVAAKTAIRCVLLIDERSLDQNGAVEFLRNQFGNKDDEMQATMAMPRVVPDQLDNSVPPAQAEATSAAAPAQTELAETQTAPPAVQTPPAARSASEGANQAASTDDQKEEMPAEGQSFLHTA